ncbi:hypothetical protein CRV00_12410 [Malaciobacter molluscorum]|uniref:hypothetical protein n=1 Tax=Malaciobacter molluscorum TaxID=1032072 RepID=UPI00100AA096|nr:hypothetical protein [Malaciobacter molluscorum]RXJ92818.1 hypothetical protein CRV00_12410 [Malaciobacter molluscorum]
MFNQGLSLEQAPPISVPFRFFLTAPFFAILIGIMFLVYPADVITNRYSNESIAVAHLFTLGVLSMIIFGAMQQMLPVLAGAIIKKAKLFAFIVHTSLTLGTLFFAINFLNANKLFLLAAIVCLAISFFTFFLVAIYLLFKVKYLTSTVNVMRLFAITGLLTVIWGIYLAISHFTGNLNSNHFNFVNIHIILGIFGFASLLIIGVSFQVIPMFYVALSFPKNLQNRLPLSIFILIISYIAFAFLDLDFYIYKILFTIFLIIYAFNALNALNNRKRIVEDVTLWFWKISLYSLVIAMLNWLFVPQDSSYFLTVLFAFGFLYSLLQGMIYKIIPFLCWFHLSSKGYFNIPTIREIINEDLIKIHFYVYILSLVFFILYGFFNELFFNIAACLFILSNILFLINCIIGMKKYTTILKEDSFQTFVQS